LRVARANPTRRLTAILKLIAALAHRQYALPSNPIIAVVAWGLSLRVPYPQGQVDNFHASSRRTAIPNWIGEAELNAAEVQPETGD
jgi:hypothetical protein